MKAARLRRTESTMAMHSHYVTRHSSGGTVWQRQAVSLPKQACPSYRLTMPLLNSSIMERQPVDPSAPSRCPVGGKRKIAPNKPIFRLLDPVNADSPSGNGFVFVPSPASRSLSRATRVAFPIPPQRSRPGACPCVRDGSTPTVKGALRRSRIDDRRPTGTLPPPMRLEPSTTRLSRSSLRLRNRLGTLHNDPASRGLGFLEFVR
jgi:hypothetical protein